MGGSFDLLELYSDQIPIAGYGKFPAEPVRVKLDAPGVLSCTLRQLNGFDLMYFSKTGFTGFIGFFIACGEALSGPSAVEGWRLEAIAQQVDV